MSEAATTLPTSATTPTTPTTWWQRLGCTVSAPGAGFRALSLDERARPGEAVGVYVVVVLAVAAADVFRLLALAGTAPGVAASRILDVLVRAARTDLAVVAGAVVVVAALAWARADESDRRRRALGAAIATSYLLVPLAMLKAIGGLCAFAGFEFWFLPHRAVDSFAVVVGEGRNQHVDPMRFVVKCAVSYAAGLAVLLHWLIFRQRVAAAVRPFVARAGFTVVVVGVSALVVAACADVAARSEQLRPRLAGDAFPSLALRKLDSEGKRKGGRVDIVEVAAAGSKAVVVDFWASWCGPCRRSIPELSRMNDDWRHRGVVVIGVNREAGDVDAAKKAWAELHPSFRSLIDDRGLGERLGLTSLPSSYVLDGRGIIRHLHLGYTDPAVVQAEVEALLAE